VCHPNFTFHCNVVEIVGTPCLASARLIALSALKSSIFLAAFFLCSSAGWTYRMVIWIVVWPNKAPSVGRSTPAITARDA